MKTLLFCLFSLSLFAQNIPQENYPLDSASIENKAVPQGEILKFTFDKSTIFPGTFREISIYVPAQYNPKNPACVYINQDGLQWKAPTVFDNLIHTGQMPITIGIFVTSGKVKAQNPDQALDRFNRSFEYDGLGDVYARFLLEELLPFVESQKTSNGREIVLSKNANDRAIGGASSGAVCAFTAAWERSEAFSRVFSSIGTYVGLRGADQYPTLIRKTEPKPIRVFLQDGSNDLNIYAGDWWKANETMQRALAFAGYEQKYVWGEGGHNPKHGTAIFAQAMRWLWKDWPKVVAIGQSKNQFLSEILIENQFWQQDSLSNHAKQEAREGNFRASYFDTKTKKSLPIKNLILKNNKGQAIDIEQHTGFEIAGACLSPDQTQLYVTIENEPWVWIYSINANAKLSNKQRFGWLHSPDQSKAGAKGLSCDRDGRIYVATSLGIQVLDQLGRVNAILPLPKGTPTQMIFGGTENDTLFVKIDDKIYGRKLNVKGTSASQTPNKPTSPRL